MQEYLVRHRGSWWHFYLKPFYGLCYRKFESGRFAGFEVLFPDAQADFNVTVVGESIHLVCQDSEGRIIYLTLIEEAWTKTVLLESKSPAPYPKYFELVPIGKYINLFYVISYQDKSMLVHQILGVERPPSVVDRITPRMPMFLASSHLGNDISVYYENEKGISGCRVFRWSQKSFTGFVPVHPSLGGRVCAILPELGGRALFGALQNTENIMNLVCFEQKQDGQYGPGVVVNLDCPDDGLPIFCPEEEKLFMAWRESGSIMSAFTTDGGGHWSKPVRYMQGSGVVPVLYTVCEKGRKRQVYGFEKDQSIIFYTGFELKDIQAEEAEPAFRPTGYEAEDFAKEMGGMEEEPVQLAANPITDLLQKEVLKLKEQIFSIRKQLSDIDERVNQAEKENV